MSPKAAPRSRLEWILRSGRFAVTAEMQPTNGADPEEVRRFAGGLGLAQRSHLHVDGGPPAEVSASEGVSGGFGTPISVANSVRK